MTCLAITDADMVMYVAASAAQHTWYLVYPKGHPQKEEFMIGKYEYSKVMKEELSKLGKKPEDFDVVKEVEIKDWFQAKMIVDNMISKIYSSTGASQAVFFLSDKQNFRHEIAKHRPYKQRDKEKPHYYQRVKDYLIDRYKAVIVEGMEADDAVGIMAEACEKYEEPFVIVSGDKDLNQIPGVHYDFLKEKLYHVQLRDSVRFFFRQVLTGDTTDTIDGLPGVGEAKAEKILADAETFQQMEEAVREAYLNHEVGSAKAKTKRKFFESEEQAIDYLNEIANLVYIRRHHNQGVKL